MLTLNSPAPDGSPDSLYKFKLTARNGTAPFKFSLESGRLPPGIKLKQNGRLKGLPTARGKYILRVKIQDANGLWGPTAYGFASHDFWEDVTAARRYIVTSLQIG